MALRVRATLEAHTRSHGRSCALCWGRGEGGPGCRRSGPRAVLGRGQVCDGQGGERLLHGEPAGAHALQEPQRARPAGHAEPRRVGRSRGAGGPRPLRTGAPSCAASVHGPAGPGAAGHQRPCRASAARTHAASQPANCRCRRVPRFREASIVQTRFSGLAACRCWRPPDRTGLRATHACMVPGALSCSIHRSGDEPWPLRRTVPAPALECGHAPAACLRAPAWWSRGHVHTRTHTWSTRG